MLFSFTHEILWLEQVLRSFPKPSNQSTLDHEFDLRDHFNPSHSTQLRTHLDVKRFACTAQNQSESSSSKPSKPPVKPAIGSLELESESMNPIAEQLIAFGLREQLGHCIRNVFLCLDPTHWANFGSNIPSRKMAGHGGMLFIQGRLNLR